jgi:hypothetical protein
MVRVRIGTDKTYLYTEIEQGWWRVAGGDGYEGNRTKQDRRTRQTQTKQNKVSIFFLAFFLLSLVPSPPPGLRTWSWALGLRTWSWVLVGLGSLGFGSIGPGSFGSWILVLVLGLGLGLGSFGVWSW